MTRIYTYIINRLSAFIAKSDRRHNVLSYGLMPVLGVVAMLSVSVPVSRAFPLDTYTSRSLLADGYWVKVSVTSTGMVCVPDAKLREWGFSDPSKVKVYGYGGSKLSDVLDLSNYRDDLPQAASEYVPGSGLYFYAEGPGSYSRSLYDAEYYKPVINPYSGKGYYFLSASPGEERLMPPKSAAHTQRSGQNYFYDRVFHKQELISPGEAGFLLLGEDFKYTSSRSFQFALPGELKADDEHPVYMEASFVANPATGKGTVSYTVNGSRLPQASSDVIATISDKYSHGAEALSRKSFIPSGSNVTVDVGFSSTGTIKLANLNYISLSFPRAVKLPSSKSLNIYIEAAAVELDNASEKTRVWDVSNPAAITSITLHVDGKKAYWPSTAYNQRTYAAWEPSTSMPVPAFEGVVAAQNLHGLETPDMVIFTPVEWKDQAERLAAFHRNDKVEPLKVLVLTPEQIYNEFSSGNPDVQAFRRIMKMMYDRGNTQEGSGLRYAIMMSRPTYDYRRKTSKVQAMGYPMLPAWFTDRGLHDNDSYTSDDHIAFLEDGSGINVGRDQLSVAIGRLPVTSRLDAQAAVDKIIDYAQRSPKGIWRNTIMVVADDQDEATHMKQADRMVNRMLSGEAGNDFFYKKLYTDEFELIGGVYPEARQRFYRYLDEGVSWWTFQGHANPSSLTGEGLVTYSDLNSLYLRHLPVVYAATCDFMRWDSAITSGAEILFKNPSGGVIAAISATRPVFISDNGHLSESFGRYLTARDKDGRLLTIGEIYRQAKNHYRLTTTVVSNTNKLRYVLLGDPALRTVTPSKRVVVTHIAGVPVEAFDGDQEPPTLMARQNTTVRGYIVDEQGNRMPGFNGVLSGTLYDAEYSVVTRGNGDQGAPHAFQQQGGRLFVGNDRIENGEFEFKVSMPAEVADLYSPAAFNFYAYSDDGQEAIGVSRDFYVYGTDPEALPDDVPPVIRSMYLNHPDFENGQEVNPSPMLMATVTDDRAINLSTAGVGHQMVLYLDNGARSFTDVADYFTPFTDGRPGGTICYPFDGLGPGYHTLRLRVWDTAPNSAEATVEFNVVEGLTPNLYDVYTDCNPATTAANFYISHDRPDRPLSVTIEVYNLMGRKLWTGSQTGRSDMFTSAPVTWDLTDEGGRRVPRGIYLYRAIVSDEESGEESATASRKLAVAGAF